MDELPSLVLVALLEHLPYADLLRCRQVSKLWKQLIDHSVSKHQLILFVEANRQPTWWEHNGEPVNLANSLKANYSTFKSATFFEIFKSVKSLLLSFGHFFGSESLVDSLTSHFGDILEHLQIDCQSNSSLEGDQREFKLALKNLQTFCFHTKSRFRNFFKPFDLWPVQCDRLTQLYTDAEIASEVSQTIDHRLLIAQLAPNLTVLFANRISLESLESLGETLTFPRLQCLGCGEAPDAQFLTFALPSLSEFHFVTGLVDDLPEARRSIDEFLKFVKRQGRKVDVFWLGMKFTLENLDRNLAVLSQLKPFGTVCTATTVAYFKENRSILNFDRRSVDLPIFYSDTLANQLNDQVDRQLISSLRRCLSTVFLEESHRELDVPKLAGLFKLVNKLVLTQLKRNQFDALPTIFPYLRVFYLSLRVVQNIDLTFVSAFKSLYLFHVDSPPPLATLSQLLTKCRYLHLVSFEHGDREIVIRIGCRYVVPSERRFDLRLSLTSENGMHFDTKENLLEYLFDNQLVQEDEPIEKIIDKFGF